MQLRPTSNLAAITVAALLSAASAGAQTRPLQTEEATTARRGTSVLEIGAEAIHDEPNFVTGGLRDRWAGPILRFVHSPADNVEIDVEWTVRVGQVDDPDFGSVSDWGDVALRAKVRFMEEREGRPAIAARFGVILPETSFGNGLGPNALRMSAQVLVSKTLGAMTLHGNAGLALHDEVYRPHEQRDFLAYGLATELRASRRLAVRGGVGRPRRERNAGRGRAQRAAGGSTLGRGRLDRGRRAAARPARRGRHLGSHGRRDPPLPLGAHAVQGAAHRVPLHRELADQGGDLGPRRAAVFEMVRESGHAQGPDRAAAPLDAVGRELDGVVVVRRDRLAQRGQAARDAALELSDELGQEAGASASRATMRPKTTGSSASIGKDSGATPVDPGATPEPPERRVESVPP